MNAHASCFRNGMAAAPQVAARLGAFMGWDKARSEKELRAYQEQMDLVNAFRK